MSCPQRWGGSSHRGRGHSHRSRGGRRVGSGRSSQSCGISPSIRSLFSTLGSTVQFLPRVLELPISESRKTTPRGWSFHCWYFPLNNELSFSFHVNHHLAYEGPLGEVEALSPLEDDVDALEEEQTKHVELVEILCEMKWHKTSLLKTTTITTITVTITINIVTCSSSGGCL